MPITVGELIQSPDTLEVQSLNLIGLGNIYDTMKGDGYEGPGTPVTVLDLKTFLDTLNDDDKVRWNALIVDYTPVVVPSTPVIDPDQLQALAKPDKTERISRQLIGGLFCLVMAFTILVLTSTVAIVSIDKKEFPSTTLVATIVIPSMMVAWYYMGIINKERKDILSAVLGDKVNSSTLADVIVAFKNRRQ